MKREERKTLNYIRRTVDRAVINIDIPVSYSHEGRQAIHEELTINKHFTAKCIEWNDILNEYCIAYSSERNQTERQNQESRDIDDIMKELRKTDYTWNGYLKPGTDPDEDLNDTDDNQTTEPEPASEPEPARTEANPDQVKREIEATKDYQTGHHVFRDTDSGELITLDQLYKEYMEARNESQTEYSYSFTHYLFNCLFRNGGTLEEVKPRNIFPF